MGCLVDHCHFVGASGLASAPSARRSPEISHRAARRLGPHGSPSAPGRTTRRRQRQRRAGAPARPQTWSDRWRSRRDAGRCGPTGTESPWPRSVPAARPPAYRRAGDFNASTKIPDVDAGPGRVRRDDWAGADTAEPVGHVAAAESDGRTGQSIRVHHHADGRQRDDPHAAQQSGHGHLPPERRDPYPDRRRSARSRRRHGNVDCLALGRRTTRGEHRAPRGPRRSEARGEAVGTR